MAQVLKDRSTIEDLHDDVSALQSDGMIEIEFGLLKFGNELALVSAHSSKWELMEESQVKAGEAHHLPMIQVVLMQ